MGAREKQREERDAQAAQRHQSEFDLLAGEPARKHRTRSDPNREHRKQNSNTRLRKRQHISSENWYDRQEKRAQKTKPRDASTV